jgi:hypothetical protein
MSGVAVDPRQINSFDVRGWFNRGMDLRFDSATLMAPFPASGNLISRHAAATEPRR